MSEDKLKKNEINNHKPDYGHTELKKIQDSKLREQAQNNQKTTKTTSEGRPNKGGRPGSED
jgi:hypothetical protein